MGQGRHTEDEGLEEDEGPEKDEGPERDEGPNEDEGLTARPVADLKEWPSVDLAVHLDARKYGAGSSLLAIKTQE